MAKGGIFQRAADRGQGINVHWSRPLFVRTTSTWCSASHSRLQNRVEYLENKFPRSVVAGMDGDSTPDARYRESTVFKHPSTREVLWPGEYGVQEQGSQR